MVIQPNENSDDLFIISHTFEAEQEHLFHMWLDPEVYVQWMGPSGAQMSFLRVDIREGGTSLWQMTTPDGVTKFGKLLYKNIQPHQQLQYVQHFCDQQGNFIKAPFSESYPDYLLLTVNFIKEAENSVKMTVRWEIVGESTEMERKTFDAMKPFMVQGWTESFRKMEVLLTN